MRLRFIAPVVGWMAGVAVCMGSNIGAQQTAHNVAHTPNLQVQVLAAPGVDIDPYLKKLMTDVHAHWVAPEQAVQAETDISFSIGADGSLESVHLDSGAQDQATSKAAWAAITGTKYAPLPWGMRESKLKLRLRFFAG